jgi:L-lactate dehydrogenase complex protein LldF
MMGVFRYPALYRLASTLGRPLLAWLSAHPRWMKKLPILAGWASGRTLPAPESHTFLGQWQRQLAARSPDNKL